MNKHVSSAEAEIAAPGGEKPASDFDAMIWGAEKALKSLIEYQIESLRFFARRTSCNLEHMRRLRRCGNPQEIEQLTTAVQVSAERALHQVRKNTSETAVIEQGFADILEELVNNAVHTRQMVDRIDGLIVKPLHGIVTVDFPSVDGAIGVFKLANEKGNDPAPAIDESVEQINVMVERMKKVLAEMQDLAKFHEAISKLKAIIDDSQQIKQQTEDERKRSIINRVRDLGLDE